MTRSYQSHLETAHNIWKSIVQPGDTVIDATCGNGHDMLFLAKLLFSSNGGLLYAIDIQAEAIMKARDIVAEHLSEDKLNQVRFIRGCHSIFPEDISKNSVKLIVYNLGYLPGGNKMLTTLLGTTLTSINAALELLVDGGVISITCYPGHEEGKVEEDELMKFASALDPKVWVCSHQRWLNRQKAPSLLLISKRSHSYPKQVL